VVAEVDVRARPVEHRSLLWNVLVAGKSVHRALHGLLRLPRKSERLAARRALERVGLGGREVETASGLGAVDRARLALASALVRPPEVLVAREIDRGFDGAEAASVSALLPARRPTRPASPIGSSRSPTACSCSTACRPTSAVSGWRGASAPRSPAQHPRELFTYPHCPQGNPPSVPSNTLFAVL
jgi:hypothetical protein